MPTTPTPDSPDSKAPATQQKPTHSGHIPTTTTPDSPAGGAHPIKQKPTHSGQIPTTTTPDSPAFSGSPADRYHHRKSEEVTPGAMYDEDEQMEEQQMVETP